MENKAFIRIFLAILLLLQLSCEVLCSTGNFETVPFHNVSVNDNETLEELQKEELDIFNKYKKWGGIYTYANEQFLCFMNVTSFSSSGTVYFNLSLADSLIKLEGTLFESNRILLKMVRNFYHGPQLNDIHEIDIAGILRPHISYTGWILEGTLINPTKSQFGQFKIRSEDGISSAKKETNYSRQAGLAFGITVPLAVLGIVGFGFLLHWAYKKGYLRYVPRSYGSLDNLDEKNPSYQVSNGSVHI